MKPLTIAYTTFLKICALPTHQRIREVSRYTSPGGYDYYRSMKKNITSIAYQDVPVTKAKKLIGQLGHVHERNNNWDGVKAFHNWMKKNKPVFVGRPSAQFTSPGGLLKIKLQPEIAFLKDGTKTALYMWNNGKPELANAIAGMGLYLLRLQLGKGKYSDFSFGIFNLRKKKIVDESIITNTAPIQLNCEIASIELLWKELSGK